MLVEAPKVLRHVPASPFLFLGAALVTLLPEQASARAFLEDHATTALLAHNGTFRAAAEAVLGCRADDSRVLGLSAAEEEGAAAHLAKLEQLLEPLWQTLPKNKHGRVEWRMLRYVAHRHFMKQSSLFVRGFEPSSLTEDDTFARVSVIAQAAETQQEASPLAQVIIAGERTRVLGYSLHDAASMVATIEQLIFNSEENLLLAAYDIKGFAPSLSLPLDALGELLEVYLALWIMTNGRDVGGLKNVVQNKSKLRQVLPSWDSVQEFGLGVLRSRIWQRRNAAFAMRPGDGAMAIQGRFSFSDVHDVVGQITKSFALFWESQCQSIKSSLQKLDPMGTGRVSLARFYHAARQGEWRFGESVAYLRDLGIIEESSLMNGPQLLIPNYVQGISNCIVSNSNYHVCCASECEDVLNDIETAVGNPVATAEHIFEALSNRSGLEDEAPRISSKLRNQLRRLAETHGGKVPLHGRLFAQWLHFVFPQECPFPHKSGSAQTHSIHELGDAAFSSKKEMERHANTAELEESAALEEERWLSQWSEEEELLADYSQHVPPRWHQSLWILTATSQVLIVAAGFTALLPFGSGVLLRYAGHSEVPGFSTKAHVV